MAPHQVGTRQEWLAARLRLLEAEKELTRRGDEIAAQRERLPWVRVDKHYRFDTDGGTVSLPDLFRGRSQLLVYHFMFGPDFTAGCPSCSAIADGFDGLVPHLAHHDVTLAAVSRAPLSVLHAYRTRMGWSFPWHSCGASDFNADFGVFFTEEEQQRAGITYNYAREPVFEWRSGEEGGGRAAEDQFAVMCGVDAATYHRDRPGVSAFALQDASSTTRIRRTGVVWTICGACTSGSIGRRAAATNPGCGGVATTNMTINAARSGLRGEARSRASPGARLAVTRSLGPLCRERRPRGKYRSRPAPPIG